MNMGRRGELQLVKIEIMVGEKSGYCLKNQLSNP
jgi:hypothetical protein